LERLSIFLLSLSFSFLYYQDIFDNWFFYDDALALSYATEPLKEILFGLHYSISYYTPLVDLFLNPIFFSSE